MKVLENMCFRRKTWLTTKAALPYNRYLKFRCGKRPAELYKYKKLAGLCSFWPALVTSDHKPAHPWQPLLGLGRQVRAPKQQDCSTGGCTAHAKAILQHIRFRQSIKEFSPALAAGTLFSRTRALSSCWQAYCKPMSDRTMLLEGSFAIPGICTTLTLQWQGSSFTQPGGLCWDSVPSLGRQKLLNRRKNYFEADSNLDMKRGAPWCSPRPPSGSGSSDSSPEMGIFLLSPSSLPENLVDLVWMARSWEDGGCRAGFWRKLLEASPTDRARPAAGQSWDNQEWP